MIQFAEAIIVMTYYILSLELVLSILKQGGIKGPEFSYPRIAAAMRERPYPEPAGVQAALDSVKTSKSKLTLAKDAMDAAKTFAPLRQKNPSAPSRWPKCAPPCGFTRQTA